MKVPLQLNMPSGGGGAQGSGFWGHTGIAGYSTVEPTAAVIVTANNQQRFLEFFLSYSVIVRKITAVNGANIAGQVNLGLANAAGNILVDSGGMSTAFVAGTVLSAAITAVSLVPGIYRLVWGATLSTVQLYISNIAFSQQSAIYNKNVVRAGTAAGVLTGGALQPLGALTPTATPFPWVFFES